MTMRAAGLGSMPGTDFAEAVRVVLGRTPDLAAVPVLPHRGVEAAATGRTLSLLAGLATDLQPAGWRLTDHAGVDARRAASLLARDLETVEDLGQGFDGTIKEQVLGPWTLATRTDLPRGEKVLSDHGARRDLAESLAAGLADHLTTVRRRLPGARLVVQIDEPALPDVLGARVRTASGFGRYRTVEPAEVDALLRPVVAAVERAGAPAAAWVPGEAPVSLLTGAGFTALITDGRAVVGPSGDAWAEAVESGAAVWLGTVDPLRPEDESGARERARRVLGALGLGVAEIADRLVLTPARGLDDVTPAQAALALRTAASMAADRLGE